MERNVITSTTGTAPIQFIPRTGGTVIIRLEDGSEQLYDRRELAVAALSVLAGGAQAAPA